MIREKTLGASHPDLASDLSNLAEVHYHQGQYALAEPFYKRALAIREKTLGPDHPEVGRDLSTLGEVHRAQGQYGEAEPFYERSLAIFEKAGKAAEPYQLNIATSLNNLGMIHYTRGQYEQAEPYYKRALAIFEKAHGPYHPTVQISWKNLTKLYDATGRSSGEASQRVAGFRQ
jgi:tetratricopeptide (TPR) repeat protein